MDDPGGADDGETASTGCPGAVEVLGAARELGDGGAMQEVGDEPNYNRERQGPTVSMGSEGDAQHPLARSQRADIA